MRESLACQLADSLADGGWRAKARPSQLPPPGDWSGWLILAGRGFGKTRAGAEWVIENALNGTARHIALVAPTAADARKTLIEGPSGLLASSPSYAMPIYEPSQRQLTWPNGAIAITYSAEEPSRLKGPNNDLAWLDETCAWQNLQDTWDMLQFTLRLGSHPRWLVTTTPKPSPFLKALLKREGDDVVVTRGSTFDNAANLAPSFLKSIRERYEGTRLGRQEIHAEVLSTVEGALWNQAMIDDTRVDPVTSTAFMKRIVVAIDPAVSIGGDETGIVVAGIDFDEHCFILEDLSGHYSPVEWANKAISAYHRWDADRIIAEANNGGDLVSNTIRAVNRNVPIKLVHASKGKRVRAEPIEALYQQKRVHHAGYFAELEDQLVSFAPGATFSPDRLDALVWAVTELQIAPSRGQLFFG